MKCIIIDDEPLARQGIALMLQEIPGLELCGSFSSIMDADVYLIRNTVDLIFLDIQLPQLSGIDYLQLRQGLPQVIITTAFPQYALQGFDLDVTDYLLKPIRFERFYKAVNKAMQKQEAHFSAPGSPSVEVRNNCIFVRADKKLLRVSIPDILYIEGMKDYAVLHFSQEKIIIPLNLRSVMSYLPADHFMRVSKSFIVNLPQIRYIDNDMIGIGAGEIPVGEAYKAALAQYVHRVGIIKR